MSIKNILLIGRTGSGKSTLANTLINRGNNFEEVFKESSGSVSETKHIQHQEFIVEISSTEKIRYLVVDTAGFGDTQLTNKEVLQLLQGLAPILGNEGLNQIFFVTDGRFTQAEVETYQILESTLFDKEVSKHTTIVRTKFEDFEKSEVCEADRKKLREENAELLGILKNSKIIYVDNPKMKGRYLEMAKDTRAESRKRVITYLGTCQDTYKPNNLNELNQRINNYQTKTEQLENEIKVKQQAIKDQEAKLQRDIQVAKTQQQNELENNRRNFDQQIQNSRSSYDQQLQNTRNQLQSNYQSQINESQSRYYREQGEAERRRRREIDDIKSSRIKNIGKLYCSRGHTREEDGPIEVYGKYGNFNYDDFDDTVTSISCSTCSRYYGETRSYSWDVRNTTRYTFEEWCRERSQSYAQEVARVNREIEEQERRSREEISCLQQERYSRDASFQQQLSQQTQSQEQYNNEASLNQQRYTRENQINSSTSSRETNLRNQSNQQVQSLQTQIQQAEQGRNANQTNFDQFIEQLTTPFSRLWRNN